MAETPIDDTAICPACNGSGFGVADTQCGFCGGCGGVPLAAEQSFRSTTPETKPDLLPVEVMAAVCPSHHHSDCQGCLTARETNTLAFDQLHRIQHSSEPSREPVASVAVEEVDDVREFADQIMKAAADCCADPDGDPDDLTSVTFTGRYGASLANTLHRLCARALSSTPVDQQEGGA